MSHSDHQHGHHDSGAHGHDHHHHHDHHDHGGHDHSDDVEPALQTLIWQQIEFEKIRTLNELELDSGAKIVEKSWPQRMNAEPELVSDTDEQMLMFVPYVPRLPSFPFLPLPCPTVVIFLLYSPPATSLPRLQPQTSYSIMGLEKKRNKCLKTKDHTQR